MRNKDDYKSFADGVVEKIEDLEREEYFDELAEKAKKERVSKEYESLIAPMSDSGKKRLFEKLKIELGK